MGYGNSGKQNSLLTTIIALLALRLDQLDQPIGIQAMISGPPC